ncbi:MAG: hypothetical protein HFJ72_01570, partial [Adlercreutzia sp.]|nr:hypothetical protein [Adlercreutzia sp.]
MSREVKNAVPKRVAGEGAAASTPASQKDAVAKGAAQGRAIRHARTATLLAVFAAVIVSLAFDSGLGTPSSFGIGEFFLLCPLGGLEALLASKALI